MALTDTKLRALRPTGKRFDLPDRQGLALRVGSSGSMTWTLTYRVAGEGGAGKGRVSRLASPRKRMSLGDYPAMGLADARASALAALAQAKAGVDPAKAAQAAASSDPTIADLVQRYLDGHIHATDIRAGVNVERVLRRHVLPAWGDRMVRNVTRADLAALLEAVRKPAVVELTGPRGNAFKASRGGPGAAAEVRKWVRAMFQYAVEVGIRPDNPFHGVRNRDRSRPRDRVLSMEEIRAVWHAAGAMPYPWGPFYRLLLLTGDRRGEWAAARWDWLDPTWSRLEIPSEHYKTGRLQVVPLSPVARRIVAGLPPPVVGPFMFSTDGGATAIAGFSNTKARLDTLAEEVLGAPMMPWVIHDLRRSMATHLERLGVPPHVIEACLGHTLKGVAGTYRRYSFLAEKTQALQRWADEVLRDELQAAA